MRKDRASQSLPIGVRLASFTQERHLAVARQFNRVADDSAGTPSYTEVTNGHVAALRKLGRMQSVIGPGQPLGGVLTSADGALHPVATSRTWRRTLLPPIHPIPPLYAHQLNRAQWSRDERTVIYSGVFQPHFGHFIVDSLSRAWLALEMDGERLPVVVQSPAQSEIPGFAKTLFASLGLHCGLPEPVHHSTIFSRILVPSPSFIIGAYSSEKFRSVCGRVADRILAGTQLQPTSQPLYISRSRLPPAKGRAVVGEREFELFLESQGVKVVFPEELGIETQIKLINTHQTIIGTIGSGMHLLAFRKQPADVYYICQGIPNTNFFLCDRLLGHRTTYIDACYRPPDASRLPPQISLAAPWIMSFQPVLSALQNDGLLPGAPGMPELSDGEETFYKILRMVISAEMTVKRSKEDAAMQEYAQRYGASA